MAEEQASYLKVSARDIEIGKPLRWSLYDGNRKLLLKKGYVIETQRQCDVLIENGLYRNILGREIGGIRSADGRAAEEEGAPAPRERMTTLDDSGIRIADVIQMQSSPDAPRYTVKLIGYLKNVSIVVTIPEADGEFVMLREGQSFIARFFSGQNAYAFTTNVSKQTSVPFPHLYLSYPREVRELEIRKGSRITVALIASVTLGGGNPPSTAAAKITNLSIGGAAIRSKSPLGNKGERVSVKFKVSIHDIDSFLVFDSLIRSGDLDPSDPAMPYSYGIQFVDVEPGMTLALAAYVYQKLAENAKR